MELQICSQRKNKKIREQLLGIGGIKRVRGSYEASPEFSMFEAKSRLVATGHMIESFNI